MDGSEVIGYVFPCSVKVKSFVGYSVNRSSTRRSRSVCICMQQKQKQQTSQPWPVGRFIKDALFFSPFAKALNLRPKTTTSPENLSPKTKNNADSLLILVTGATGGTGKRVVKRLIELNAQRKLDSTLPPIKIRALVRNIEAAKETFAKVGVDVDSLELFVGDLANTPPDFYKGSPCALISCTGTKVGPVDDTPDREKYYQGLVFYPPTIMENTPENVEYRGLKKIVSDAELYMTEKPVLEFVSKQQVDAVWGVVDDVVMGGVSESRIEMKTSKAADGSEVVVGQFQGFVSEANRGGFASVRTAPFDDPLDVSDHTQFRLQVKGDGQRYKLIVRCNKKWDSVGFCYSFDTVKDQWIDVLIPFEKLRPVFRAKTLPDSDPNAKFEPSEIFALQMMLSKFEYDGALNPNFTPGPFTLEIASLSAVGISPRAVVQHRRRNKTSSSARDSVQPEFPRIIHIGSAGCTRVLRPSEFPDESKLPPAVKMNAMLGRIMEWKLSGEDSIRESALDHVIIRPCALTEEPLKGYSALRVGQGDTMTGKLSREDLATLAVDCVFSDSLVNKTIEVSEIPEDGQQSQTAVKSLDELVKSISETDSNLSKTRTFAEYPYIPK